MKKLINFTGQVSPHLSRKLTYLMLLLITLMGGTGSAWADEVTTVTWDYNCVTEMSYANQTLTANGLDLTVVNNGGGTSDYVNNAESEFLHWNGTSQSTIRYAKFTAPHAGVVTVVYKSNNGSATNRIVAVGKSVVTGTDVSTLNSNDEVYKAGYTNGSTEKTIRTNVYKGDVYIYNANEGCNIKSITYTYTTSVEYKADDLDANTLCSYNEKYFSLTHSNAKVTANNSEAKAACGSPTFTKAFLPGGASNSESACYTLTPKVKAEKIVVYYTLTDGSFSSKDQSKGGSLKYKIGSGAEQPEESVVGSNTVAYVATIQPDGGIDANTVVKIYSSANRLAIFSVVVYPDGEPAMGESYTVSYNMNGHGDAIPDVTDATSIPNPLPTPTASGYEFSGWYTNSALTTAANAGASISDNTTLYAKWFAAPANISDWDQTYSNQTNGKKGFTNAPTIVGTNSLTFEKGVRYSKWVINSRINDYGESDNNKHGFGDFTDAGVRNSGPTNPKNCIHYVPGFVAQGILEAVDYYRDADGDAGEINVAPWFYAVQNWGNTYNMSSGTLAGNELDGLSSIKIYSLLRKFAVNRTFGDGPIEDTTNAKTKSIANTRFFDAMSALRSYNQNNVIKSSVNANAAGGWYHKNNYANQMWCDGQYMGPATLAHIINDCGAYSQIATSGTDWDLINNQINISWNYLWNSTDNLLYHGFSAVPGTTGNKWAKVACPYDNTCSTNPAYWGRANGWYVLALVDILQQMDRAGQGSSANATNLKGKLNSLVAGLVARQAANGCWYQVLDENTTSHTGNYVESSASALFLTAIMRAQRLGYLTTDYTTQIKKGYEGFVNEFLVGDGNGGINVLYCSKSASLKDDELGDADYYINGTDAAKATDFTEGKALGAFIMAAVEYERLYLEEPAGFTVTFTSGSEGTSPVAAENVTTVPDATPSNVQTGYTFNGWRKSDGTVVAAGAAVTEDLTLYANYTFAGAEKFSMTVKSGQTVNVTAGETKSLSATELNMTAGAIAEVKNGNSTSASDMVKNGQVNIGGSSASYLHITLPAALAAGDVINITNQGVYKLTSTNSNSSYAETKGGVYTVKEDDNLIGKSDIYVWKNGGYIITNLTVKTTSLPVESVAITPNVVYVAQNAKVDVTATVLPGALPDNSVTWESADVAVATVNNGTITGKAQYGGHTTVTAKSVVDETKVGTCDVYVYRFGIAGGQTVDYKVGQAGVSTLVQSAFYDAEEVTVSATDFTFSSSNSSVINATSCSYDSSKKRITFTPTVGEAGTATLTITYNGTNEHYRGKTCTINYTVTAVSNETAPTAVEGGSISGTVITATEVAAANANTAQNVTLTLPAGASITAVSGSSASVEGNVVSYLAPAAGGNDVVTITIQAEDGSTQDYTMNVSTAQVSADSDIVSDEGNITATTALSNSDKTCTWTNIGVTEKIQKGTSSTGHGLAMIAHSANGIDAATTLPTFKNVATLYVRVPSASSAGSINIISSNSSADRKYSTKSGNDLPMANGAGSTVNFTSSDIEKFDDNYYIKLTLNPDRADYKATTIAVTLTSDETYKAKVLTANTLAVTSTTPIDLVTIGGTSTIESTSNSGATKTYSSSNESVATVNESGVVTATGTGTATITVHQDANATYSAKDVEVTVNVTIGSTTKDSGFNTCHSASYAVGTNQSREFTFTNHGNKNQNYYNWVLFVNNATSSESALINLVPQVYKDGAAEADPQTLWKIDSEGTLREMGTDDWNQFGSDMQNSTVTVQTSFSGNIFYMYATMVSPYGRTYIYPYWQSITGNSVDVRFTVEQSYITDFVAGDVEDAYQVSVQSNDEALGTTSMKNHVGYAIPNETAVAAGSEITFVADKIGENDFAHWSDETLANPYVKTIDATTNLTAIFQENVVRETYSYTVKAVDANDNVLKTIATGQYTTGDPAVVVAYPQYVLNGTTLYRIKNNTTGDYYRVSFTPDADDYVYTLKYNNGTVDNVTNYVEAEDIEGFTKTAYTNRASNGSVAYSQTVKKSITLTPGTYRIFARGLNGNSTTRTATFKVGDQTVWEFAITNGTNVTGNSNYFSVNANADLYVSSEGGSSSGLDWFYVQEVNALDVTYNEQKFPFTTESVETYKYASANAAGTSENQTRDDITGNFYNIKNSTNYVEISEMNAIAFKAFAYHGNGTDTRTVKVYVDNVEIGTIPVTPGVGVSSSVFVIPGDPNDIHTITLKGAGKDVYVADVVFYTEAVTPSVTPSNVAVNALQTKEFTITAPDGCTITSMNTVSSDIADVTYDNGKITVVGKKVGNLSAEFNVTSTNPIFKDGVATVNISVSKAQLVMRYNPDSKTYEKTESKVLPDGLGIEYYVIEDGEERELSPAPTLTMTYVSDDATVATVTNTGVITLTGNGGSASVTATFAGNDMFTAAKASFTVTVKAGFDHKMTGTAGETAGPEVNSGFTVTDDQSNVLVYGTFGGWKRNSHKYENTTDTWATLQEYNNAIDDYSMYTSGKNDASDEDRDPSTDIIYGSVRRGWFESPVTGFTNEGKPKVTKDPAPFSLPVRGTYMTFEPTKNGQLTVYILQNGAWNSSKKDVKDDDGFLVSVDENGQAIAFPGMAPWQFRPHSFYVTDQNGMPVEVYTDFKINTKQPIESGIITEERLNLKDKNGKSLYTDAQKAMVRRYCETYGVKLGDKFKCIIDPAADGYNDATNIGNWKEFKQYMSEDEQKRVAAAWNTGVNGAEQIVKLDNGSYLAVDECIMKYSFHVAAGQTYYLFSNFSKMGFSGCNFIPDETEGAQPTATLALSDKAAYTKPVLNAKEGEDNHVKGITVPQYAEISLDRTFAAGKWNTIYLPFVMTEKEVRDVFGENTQLILLDEAMVDDSGVLNLQFVYHEIQSILAGYPYLIKPSKEVSADKFKVYNKVIDPGVREMTFGSGGYTAMGTQGFSNPIYQRGKSGVYYSAELADGDIYINGGNLYVAGETPVYSNGYRAYIKHESGQKAKEVRLTMRGGGGNNDQTTDIDIVQLTEEAVESLGINRIVNGVYNINGQKISGSAKNLPAGVYIVNGKKMVVK